MKGRRGMEEQLRGVKSLYCNHTTECEDDNKSDNNDDGDIRGKKNVCVFEETSRISESVVMHLEKVSRVLLVVLSEPVQFIPRPTMNAPNSNGEILT